jgi:hypothetical protein
LNGQKAITPDLAWYMSIFQPNSASLKLQENGLKAFWGVSKQKASKTLCF